MLDALETRFLRELRRRVEEDVAQKEANIACGGLSDHASYTAACGRVAGMRDALAIADEIERKINGNGDR